MKISNTQIMDFQKCGKRFYFAHVLKLRPHELTAPMEKGLTGHNMMQLFFEKMIQGGSYEECVQAIEPMLTEDIIFTDRVSIYRHVLAFGAYVFAQPWRPVQVEEPQLATVDSDLQFAFTPDLIMEWTKGPKKGRKFGIDFKFTGQYWNERELNMYQQGPKYVIYTNELGVHKLSNFALIELYTRAAKGAVGQGLFRVKWIKLDKAKLDNIKSENELLMHRVAQARLDENYQYLRTVDSHQCKMCWFGDDLCPADLEGRPTHRIIERSYIHNTYFEDNYEQEANNED